MHSLSTLFVLSVASLALGNDCNNNCGRAIANTRYSYWTFCKTFIQSTATITITPTITVSGTRTITPAPPVIVTRPPVEIPYSLTSKCGPNEPPVLSSKISAGCECMTTDAANTIPTVTNTIVAPPATTTVLPPPIPTVCTSFPSNWTAPDGREFSVLCGSYYSGSSASTVGYTARTFGECVSRCLERPECKWVFWFERFAECRERNGVPRLPITMNSNYDSIALISGFGGLGVSDGKL